MSRLKLFRNSTPFITLGVLSICLLQPGHKAAGAPTFDPRAYIERGDRVEEHYRAYSKRLAKHYAALIVAVKEHAPDLLPESATARTRIARLSNLATHHPRRGR